MSTLYVDRKDIELRYAGGVIEVHEPARREIVGRLDLLAGIIDPRSDDIRAYPLLTNAAPVVYGRSLLACGVHFGWRQVLFDKPPHEGSDWGAG